MKTAIYLRVSSEAQDTEMQRVDLLRYCELHQLPYEIFAEKISGKNAERPELKAMIARVQAGEFSRVLIWKLDRLARSTRDLLNIIAEIETAKCTLVSFKESLDLSTPAGRLMLGVLGSIAEFELATLKQRQRAGIDMAKARGVKFGPAARPIDMSQVRELMSSGKTVRDIAKLMGIGKSVLYDRLARVS